MKLDKWPEEVECDGWRWMLASSWIGEVAPDGYIAPRYIRKEKIHTPPTMKEIMEHLLKGGWVREKRGVGTAFYKLGSNGLEVMGRQTFPHWNTTHELPYTDTAELGWECDWRVD